MKTTTPQQQQQLSSKPLCCHSGRLLNNSYNSRSCKGSIINDVTDFLCCLKGSPPLQPVDFMWNPSSSFFEMFPLSSSVALSTTTMTTTTTAVIEHERTFFYIYVYNFFINCKQVNYFCFLFSSFVNVIYLTSSQILFSKRKNFFSENNNFFPQTIKNFFWQKWSKHQKSKVCLV
jgi:hypothetical protein